METTDKVYIKLWQRLALFEVWDRWLLFFSIIVVALLSFSFDAIRLNNFTWNWLPINTIAMAIAVLFVVSAVSIAKSLNLEPRFRSAFNVACAGTAMGLKNVFTLYLCSVFGVLDSGSLLYRFVGGAAIGIGILFIYANLRGAKIERLKVQSELRDKERALIGFRENVADLFREEELELSQRTTAELLPRLLAIRDKVSKGTGKNLTLDFEKLLKDEIKPLSQSLANEARSLRQAIPQDTESKPEPTEISVPLAKSIRPISTALVVFFSWWMLAQIILPVATVTDVVVATILYQSILFAIQLSVRNLKPVSVNTAIVFAPIPGIIAAFPSYYLFYQIPHELYAKTLLPAFFGIGALACASYAMAYILDRGRELEEQKLKALVSQFTRENKLFEQKLWIAQHVWYTLLHGTVQSAVTAAAIRAGSKDKVSAELQQQIVGDINRAISALKDPVPEKVDFSQSIEALKETWVGISEIKVSIDAKASDLLTQKLDTALVANEVLKEAVSNAVKHGQARLIRIEISQTEDSDLLMVVSNNGKKPRRASESGIGSKIFDSVCLSYELRVNSETDLVDFRAVIPVA